MSTRRLSPAIQELLLALLLYDDDGAKQIAPLLTPKEFDVYYKDLAEAAEAYRSTYKQVAGEHAYDLVETAKARAPNNAEDYDRIFQSIQQSRAAGINREFVLAQTATFARRQRFFRGLQQAIQVAQRDTDEALDEALDEAEQIMAEATKNARKLFDPGIYITDARRSLAFLDRQEEAFPFGVPQLDEKGIGPTRKKMLLIEALTGRGKSWACTHIGKTNIRRRRRVAHFTLEMSEDVVCMRYVQGLFSVTKRKAHVISRNLEKDDLGKIVSMPVEILKDLPALTDPDIRGWLTARLDKFEARYQPLVIKGFPMASMSVRDLTNHLDALESADKFIPDILIVDSPDLMDIDAKNYRFSVGRIYQQVRGIAQERNIAVVVTTQANRASEGKRLLTEKDIAEDFSKAQTCDIGISYNQTKSEHMLGLARLHAWKVRDDQKNRTVLISQAYGMGQFCLNSALMGKGYFDLVDEEAGDEDGEKDAADAV